MDDSSINSIGSGPDVGLAGSTSSSICGLCEQTADILTSQSEDDQSHDEHSNSSLVNGISNNDTRENSDDDATKHAVTKSVQSSKGRCTGKQIKRHSCTDINHAVSNELKNHFPLQSDSKSRSRSSSAWSLYPGSSTKPSITPRENIASMRRKQLMKSNCTSINEDCSYITPFQRKELAIRDLRHDLQDCHDKLKLKDEEIQSILSENNVELSTMLADKDTEIHTLRDQSRLRQEEGVRVMEEQDKLKDEHDLLKLKNKEMEVRFVICLCPRVSPYENLRYQ